MAHDIYGHDQPARYDSAGYYNPMPNGGRALLAVVILFVLFFWADLPRLLGNLDFWLRGNRNSTAQPVEGSIISPATEIRRVATDNLNMREQPSNDARSGYILPRGTQVALLGESHEEMDGDVWLRVRAETTDGTRVGWVSQRYVE